MKTYPDISKLIKAKEAHRRALAALTFEKKNRTCIQAATTPPVRQVWSACHTEERLAAK